MRSAARGRWLVGALLGALIGALMLSFGAPVLIMGLLVAGVGFVSLRSLAFLSGLLAAVGATWLVLLVRATLSCAAMNARPNAGCVQPDVTGFVALSGAVLVFGIALGFLSRQGDGSPAGE